MAYVFIFHEHGVRFVFWGFGILSVHCSSCRGYLGDDAPGSMGVVKLALAAAESLMAQVCDMIRVFIASFHF